MDILFVKQKSSYLKVFSLLVLTTLIVGCSEANSGESYNLEQQIEEKQEHFEEIIAEQDEEFGKLVFYILEDSENNQGVGLSIFQESNNGNWEYSKGTAHLASTGEVYSSDYIEIDDSTKLVYGYINEKDFNDLSLDKLDEVNDEEIELNSSTITYSLVDIDQDIKFTN